MPIKKARKAGKLEKKKEVDAYLILFWVALIILFLSVIDRQLNPAKQLEDEAREITMELTEADGLAIASNDVIDETKLEQITGMNYMSLKEKLNTDKDFCVYFEDEEGNLIEIKQDVVGIGSGVIEINGKPCGS